MNSIAQIDRYLIILIDTALAVTIILLLIRLIRYVRERRSRWEIEAKKPIRWSVMSVSYTHLTLPTTERV